MILKRYSDKPLRLWELQTIFPASLSIKQANSIIVEIGPGRGDFLYHLATAHPKSLVVAIDIKRKRIDRLIERIQKRNLENVLLVQSDARMAIPALFPEESIDEIHINFPDPWPKTRHTKNRLLAEPFLKECAIRLKNAGTLFLSTDQDWYAEDVCEIIASLNEYKAEYENCVAKNPPNAFPTLFMQKWKDMGRDLYYQKYTRV